MRIASHVCAAVVSLFLLAYSQIAPAQWKWVNPLPTGNSVTALAWDGSQYIGFDTSDTVLTSPDGFNWSSTPTNLVTTFNTMAWGNGLYVAAGEDSGSVLVVTSADGLTWTPHEIGVPVNFVAQVLWNPALQQFVLIADSGVILTSANGSDWNPQGSGTLNDLRGIAWGSGQYVAVGANGTVLTSSNGTDWFDHSIANSTDPLISVAANGTSFALIRGNAETNAETDILTSTDPTDPQKWQLAFGVVDPTTTTLLNRIVWDGTNFVAVGGIVATSPDGAVWTDVSSGVGDALRAVAFSADEIIAAGGGGSLVVSALDGLAWTASSSNLINEHLTNVIWNGSVFASVSDFGSFLSSDNGLDWNVNAEAMPLAATSLSWHADRFVAVGDGGIAWSDNDGSSWHSSVSTGLNQTRFRSVAWGAGRFVAVGTIDVPDPPFFFALQQGVVYTSPDGADWTLQPSGAMRGDGILSVIWANNEFLAVGSSSFHAQDGDLQLGAPTVFTSPDGLAWTRHSPFPDFSGGTVLVSVAWNGSRFVAVGTPGLLFDERRIATSPDGVNWEYIPSLPGPDGAGALQSVAWTGGKFVTVGASSSELSSPDGLNWTAHLSGAADLSSVAANGRRCIAVGDTGTIMREDSLCFVDSVFASGFE